MGTDIHGVFQRHDATTNTWHDVPSKYEQERHYQLFAVLADVRNGYGFAGVVTGDPVAPVDAPRGLPPDFQMDGESHPLASVECMTPWRRKYHADRTPNAPPTVWMGDHSHSWLTGDEILAWAGKAPEVVHTGILNRSTYEAWDGVSCPTEYCGGISGPAVVLVNDNAIERAETPHWTHIRCHWKSALGMEDSPRAELAYFFNEVARLVAEHGQVRFVFGFDS